MLRNTTKRFGSVTKLLHWLVFILITTEYYLVWYREVFPKDSPEKALYMMLHKSIGITLLFIGVVFLIWHIINIKPLSPENHSRWQYITAKIVHRSLLILLILMPIIGYLMSCANGRPVNIFSRFTLPCFISPNEYLGDVLYNTHVKLGYLILILVGIHFLAALYNQYILKNNVLKRMLPFTSDDV